MAGLWFVAENGRGPTGYGCDAFPDQAFAGGVSIAPQLGPAVRVEVCPEYLPKNAPFLRVRPMAASKTLASCRVISAAFSLRWSSAGTPMPGRQPDPFWASISLPGCRTCRRRAGSWLRPGATSRRYCPREHRSTC